MAGRTIRTFEEYRRRFFPTEVERERVEKLTPEQRGQELAEAMLERIRLALMKAGNRD